MDKKVVIFAGNDCKGERGKKYLEMAYALGKQLAEQGFTVVTGAGLGLMEEAARGAHEAGGKTIGVGLSMFTAEGRSQSKHIHEYSSYDKLMPRQDKLISMGDAFVALPGGVGTVFEIFNVINLMRIDEIPRTKPFVMVGEYYRPVQTLLQEMTTEGFLEQQAHELYCLCETAEDAVGFIKEKI